MGWIEGQASRDGHQPVTDQCEHRHLATSSPTNLNPRRKSFPNSVPYCGRSARDEKSLSSARVAGQCLFRQRVGSAGLRLLRTVIETPRQRRPLTLYQTNGVRVDVNGKSLLRCMVLMSRWKIIFRRAPDSHRPGPIGGAQKQGTGRGLDRVCGKLRRLQQLAAALRTRGLIHGDAVTLTISDAGIRTLDSCDPLAAGSALIDYWRGRLGNAELLILETLAAAYPDALTQEELAARAHYQLNGGGFNNDLGPAEDS